MSVEVTLILLSDTLSVRAKAAMTIVLQVYLFVLDVHSNLPGSLNQSHNPRTENLICPGTQYTSYIMSYQAYPKSPKG